MSAVGFGGSYTEAKVCAPANIAAPSMAKAVCFIVLLWWYSFSCQLACANRLTQRISDPAPVRPDLARGRDRGVHCIRLVSQCGGFLRWFGHNRAWTCDLAGIC